MIWFTQEKIKYTTPGNFFYERQFPFQTGLQLHADPGNGFLLFFICPKKNSWRPSNPLDFECQNIANNLAYLAPTSRDRIFSPAPFAYLTHPCRDRSFSPVPICIFFPYVVTPIFSFYDPGPYFATCSVLRTCFGNRTFRFCLPGKKKLISLYRSGLCNFVFFRGEFCKNTWQKFYEACDNK